MIFPINHKIAFRCLLQESGFECVAFRKYSLWEPTSSGAGLVNIGKRGFCYRRHPIKSQNECQLGATYLVDNGGNVGGGATIELGISLPVIPIPCNCSGRSDVEALNPPPRPPIL